MWSRSVAAAGLLAALAAVSSAQNPLVYARATPPDRATLDRLNLRTEWTLNLPIDARDGIELIQTLDDQIFVQTRTGRIIAVDARTGRIQWTVAMGSSGYATMYPVAANSRFVFAAFLTRLYAFYRYTGVIEFHTDLGTPPTAGLAADDGAVYVTLATRPGAAGAERVAVYELPNPITVPDPAEVAAARQQDRDKKMVNPVDDLVRRYPSGSVRRPPEDRMVDEPSRGSAGEATLGGMTGSRTPSLAAAARVTPPYTRQDHEPIRSLVVVPSLRKPYRLRDETLEHNQRTPSIGTIPPSVAGALALADFRPRGVTPRQRWEYGMGVGTNFPLVLSPTRVWTSTSAAGLMAFSKADRTIEIDARISDSVSAPPGRAGMFAYYPLADGGLLAVNLAGGNLPGGISILWRANVGGMMNHAPVVTEDAVFAAGDNSGIARVERATGAVTWRTDRAIDRVVAVNQDFVYAQDRQGRGYVFDARRANGGPGRAVPLTSINLSAFNVPVVNTVSDRVYFAADNGLLICLRDASAKYAAPVRMAPAVIVNVAPKAPVAGLKDGAAPPKSDEPAPKKDDVPEKKADEVPPKKAD